MADDFFDKENGMTPRRLRCAAVLVLSGMGLVILTRLARPHLEHAPDCVVFVFGVLPNFAAAFALPFAMIVFLIQFLRFKAVEEKPSRYFTWSLAAAFLGLAAWEYIQLVVWGYAFDKNDIMATAAGCVCAAAAHALIMRRPAGAGDTLKKIQQG